jgi:hypothetical protein
MSDGKSPSILTLADRRDAFNFTVTSTVCFTPMPTSWSRVKAWFKRVVLRRKEPAPRVWRVAAVDHKNGTVTLESP